MSMSKPDIMRSIPRSLEPVLNLTQLERLLADGSVLCTEEELAAAIDKIAELVGEQQGNVKAKQQALQSSTENMGHDDAGQEAAELAAKLTAIKGDTLGKIIRHALIIPAPAEQCQQIGIGSQFIADDTDHFALVGAPDARNINRNLAPDVFPVSYESALGRAALGKIAGETITYKAARTITMAITAVKQPSPVS